METFDIHLVKDHILLDDGRGLVLVDTGSPLSFHETGHIEVCGEAVKVLTSLMETDADYVSQKVGAPVHGLIGMDLIGRYGLLVDVPGGKLAFGADTAGWTKVPSSFILGAVFFDMEVDGKKARVVLDTGAPISYVAARYTEGHEPTDTATDFSPYSSEDFTVNRFDLPVECLGERFDMRLGVLPGALGLMLSTRLIDGAVGMELLRRRPLLISDGGLWTKD